MRKTVFFSFIVITAMLLGGCATNENFIKQHNEWIGKNINDFIAQVGYPDNSYEIPNGNKIYVYNKSTEYISTGPTMSFGGYFGRRIGRSGYIGGYPVGYGFGRYDVITETCTLYMEVNKKGMIVKWGSKGNNCIADELKSNVIKIIHYVANISDIVYSSKIIIS